MTVKHRITAQSCLQNLIYLTWAISREAVFNFEREYNLKVWDGDVAFQVKVSAKHEKSGESVRREFCVDRR